MNMKIIVNTIILAVIIAFQGIGHNADTVDLKSMPRKERKEYREKIAIAQKERILRTINDRKWVLEANALQVRSGETFQLEPTLNFVGVEDENASIQLGSSFMIGANGVGGITLDGKIRKYDISEGKKPTSSVTVSINVVGASIGNVDILLSVSPNGSASATIQDNFGARLTYRGYFKTLAESKIFKGMTTY